MAKILYGIAGEGNGHAIRAECIIDELKKDHHITAFSYGKNWRTLKKYFRTQRSKKQPNKTKYQGENPIIKRIIGSYMYYINNTVSAVVTTVVNTMKLPLMLLASLRYLPYFLNKEIRPDVLITDFEPFIGYWALLFKIPMISIDNQHAITNTKIDGVKGQKIYEIYSKFVVYSYVPKKDKTIITSFFKTEIKKRHKANTTIVPPIIKQEILKKKRTNAGHILVYQTSASYTKMLHILKRINKQFIIYGFNKEKKEGNLHFKEFNNREFHKDIASADAVVINGGFTVLSEALYLHKPIFSIPIKRQFEQILNGHYINKLQYGVSVKDITEENFNVFLEKKKSYRTNIKKIKWDQNKEFFRVLHGTIKELTGKNNNT
jgi:uncharacterized protein (TIGR00661 family)